MGKNPFSLLLVFFILQICHYIEALWSKAMRIFGYKGEKITD
jgi:hypothetical protein